MASTFEIWPIVERETWDDMLARLPNAHVLQSWDWGDFKQGWGWQARRLCFLMEGKPVAAAQVLLRRLPRTPFTLAYVPKGPALDFGDGDTVGAVLATLEVVARRSRSLFIKIDPDLWLGSGTDSDQVNPLARSALNTIRRRGWRTSREQIQFKNTVVVDLLPDEDTLLAAMKAKTRYNLRLAERKGVEVAQAGKDDLAPFYHLYQLTSRRDGFLIRPFAYYRDVWCRFVDAGRARLLLARVNGQPVAGLILFAFAGTAWYMYGASGDEHRELMPNVLLQWEAMRMAKALGCSRYDMWGAPDRFDESESMWGVYRFKTGFGGETWRGAGAHDYAPSTPLYFGYSVIMPILLRLMRSRHGFSGQ